MVEESAGSRTNPGRRFGRARGGLGKGAGVVSAFLSPTKFAKAAITSWSTPEERPAFFTAGAAGALILGRKAMAVGLMTQAARDFERALRDREPDRGGGLMERLESAVDSYQARHTHPVTRAVHVASLPLIAGGTVGLFMSRPLFPLWNLSVGALGVGYAVNVGTQLALEDAPLLEGGDPLALAVGPLWDIFHPRQALSLGED